MNEPDSTSPRDHLSALVSLMPRAIRAAWVGGIALAIGLGVTVAWTLSTAHLYRSEAVIAYEHGVRSGSVGTGLDGDSARDINTRLRDALNSRQRLERAIKDLNLYRRIVDGHGIGDAIDEMRKHIAINGREGFTYRVSFDGSGRELTQRVLDWLLKDVVDEDAQRRVKDAEDTKSFLDAERKHADEDLKAKEGALASFLAKHPQLAGEAGGSAAMAGGLIRAADRANVAPASGEIAGLELQAAQMEEALVAAGVRPPPSADGVVSVDPVLSAARSRAHTELQTAQRELTEKQALFTNQHPDVKAALRNVAVAEAALHRADAAIEAQRRAGPAAAMAATPEDEGAGTGRTAALRRALSAIRAQIAALKTRSAPREVPQTTSSVVAIDTEWTRLNRDVSAAREQQAQLEAKQFQAQLLATLVGGGQGGRLVVVDPPYRPMRPIAGGRFKIALVGVLASMVLSLLTIGLFSAFDDRLYGLRDVERVVKDGIVVVVPKLTGKSG
jgi:hypothetical protein